MGECRSGTRTYQHERDEAKAHPASDCVQQGDPYAKHAVREQHDGDGQERRLAEVGR